MTLKEVLAGVRVRNEVSKELEARTVEGLEYDSRRVQKDFVFVAFQGAHADGSRFADEAMGRGAMLVMSEMSRPSGFTGPWLQVEHGRKALASASRNFYGAPDEKVFFTGITGTNGKTTTSFLTEAILKTAGNVTGLIGTIAYRMADKVLPAANTTPESLDVMRFASELRALGGTHLVSEISSHALSLGRVWGFHFHTAVFTNLTRDHLDFHHTMEEYAAAKRLLFVPQDGPAPRWAVLNADDPEAKQMQPGPGTHTIWYGLSSQADLQAANVQQGFDGSSFDLCWAGKKQQICSPMVGAFNVSNMLAAAGTALSYGLDLDMIAKGIASCASVPGRFERIDCGQPFLVVVDYAHTDDALRNVLRTARAITKKRVLTLFGCGGDRDRSKRPLMGMAAAELSDFVAVTSDNPRSEDPLAIINDTMVGVGRSETPRVVEPDRATAIQSILAEARPGDVVVLAGKGHETYQILKDRTIDFDDRLVARAVLRKLGYEK
jgi:UDP-N-acetylmuramoyl-L-alanyl-D-glutamate--2,6-diaminopimelate ligase